MPMNSIEQGQLLLSNKASKNSFHHTKIHNSKIPGVETSRNISRGMVEGFTGSMGPTDANTRNQEEAVILKQHQQRLDKALSEYAQAKKVLMEETSGFINSENRAEGASRNMNLGVNKGTKHQLKVVKYSDGKLAVVTDKGIIKPMSNSVWENIKGLYSCPSNITETSDEPLGSPQEGSLWGKNKQFVGAQMTVQGCHPSTGINARVMSASDPLLAGSSYQGSILSNSGSGAQFEYQSDLDQTWDQVSAGDNKLDLCASRAVDLGRTGYAVWRDGYNGNVKCSVAPEGDWDNMWKNSEIAATAKINTVIGSLDANRWNSVSMMYDGRITKSDIPEGQQINEQGVDFNNYVSLTDKKVDNETDPTVGSRIHVKNATYGMNCNGQENVAATDAAWRAYNDDVFQLPFGNNKSGGGSCTVM